MPIRFIALDAAQVLQWRTAGLDANGQVPERHDALMDGLPCRCCLDLIKTGEPYLILAHRPFTMLQPYAEVGPIFLHAEPCMPGGGNEALPAFLDSPHYLMRGYGRDERIVYGSGRIVATGDIPAQAEAMFDDPRIAFIHVRSASNTCYHCRIERA
jgi:hypothetical protein